MKAATLHLTLPEEVRPVEHRRFRGLCAVLAATLPNTEDHDDRQSQLVAAGITNLYPFPYLAAAANALLDLWEQGWRVSFSKRKPVLSPPSAEADVVREKNRIRQQELVGRTRQLDRPSVQRFIRMMEGPREHDGRLLSIFDLMRDGRHLAEALEQSTAEAIQPYVQIVDDSIDSHTGLRLHDIWRYFRHTWSNPYGTVPGRSMEILVRDAAAPCHPVIGLAAVSSAVVQIAERDEWIGWSTDAFLRRIQEQPTEAIANWLLARIDAQLSAIYTDDLIRDGVIQPHDLQSCPSSALSALRADAEHERLKHHQATLKQIRKLERSGWEERAQTPLFRSKRSAALAEVFEIASDVRAHLQEEPTAENLSRALADSATRQHIGRLIRHARGERVGTVIADLTVCGAVPPYNALAAGKLVGALAVSPTVLKAYRERYDRPSEIASAMAGRDVVRESRLAFVGTTSLYGAGSSQYNRLFWPADTLGGSSAAKMGYYRLGRSRSYGTSHFSSDTIEAFVRLAEQVDASVRVNSVFGEGVSPRLRKVRIGLAALGWPANDLLRHGRERIVYGVPLVENLLDYCLGIDQSPKYMFEIDLPDAERSLASWWLGRWGNMRAAKGEVLDVIRSHTLVRPVSHGARVVLPDTSLER
ncbi:MAG: DUF4338 domain-containing protein [Bifidobacteriaceae bacterium]|jgi:hypothetical protein|nr:DUF4338 domain-containing protein [Bifidobacteriaceae bacterium]